MDNADIAQRQQEMLLAQQLANRQTHTVLSTHNQTPDGNYECIDCGELVEPQRVRLGLSLRCMGCQQQHEKRSRT